MSVQETNLAAIADAIREKEGSTEPIPAEDFAPRILALPSSGLPEGVRTITVTSSDPDMGTVSGGGVASDGMMVTVSAEGAAGYDLKRWVENGEEVSTKRTYSFQIESDRELEAIFDYSALGVWKQIATGNEIQSYLITYGDGKFVILGWGKAMYSIDGINWETTTLPNSQQWNSVAYGGGKFVAIYGAAGSAQDVTIYSSDGVNWEVGQLPFKAGWTGITYGNGRFVAIAGFDGYNSPADKVAYSEDGITWQSATLPEKISWTSICYGDGKFIVSAGNSLIVAYSNDGISWSTTTLPAISENNEITYGDGKFIIVGRYRGCSYSVDGISWDILSSLNSIGINLDKITFGDGKFVAFPWSSGDKGAYSSDGITWNVTQLPSSQVWKDVAYGNGLFVAVTNDGKFVCYAQSKETI